MTEEQLLKELKSGTLRRVYYLYGVETFLVETYAERIIAKCFDGNEDDRDSNLVKFSGIAELSDFVDAVDTIPMFSDKKVVLLSDPDIEKLDADSAEMLASLFGRVHDMVCVVIRMTGIQPDLKKAKTKKIIAVLEKSGKQAAVVNFEKMSEAKTADLITRRVNRMGCSISRNNAARLARLCLRNLTLIACETDKLCAYVDYKGEITEKSLELLTARQLDSVVFALSVEITSKRGANSMKLLDELIDMGNAPVAIVSVLSMTFLDFYRAKLGIESGKRAEQIAKDFGYAANRAWAVGKAMSAASRLSVGRLRSCVRVLCDADYKLKSSPAGDRLIIERAIAELLTLC
ncbi:MAG: DNA polymerase III subunit delta [Oscillospiraceae bacterium]|nr:DNA polymerase III subunit delta [Oscillospiraceae bacterium]